MSRRPRCTACGRLTIPVEPPYRLPSLVPLREHMVTLLEWARDFDGQSPEGECFTAVDVIDYIALNAACSNDLPAGRPGSKDKAA